MSAEITLPAGAPEEVVTNALVRDIDLAAFGGKGTMALITLDNGHDHNRPNTFGPLSVKALDAAITDAIGRNPAAIAITGKPFIFAAAINSNAFIGEAIVAPPYFFKAAAFPVARADSHAGSLL